MPWAGHYGAYARWPRSTRRSRRAGTTLVFVNTRAQAEFAVPGAVAASTTTTCRSRCTTARSPPSSGARSRRPWRAAALRAVVCTSTLDLGIDWGDVDLVIQLAAPKGASRAGAADRPRQPPPRRAVAAPAGAGQPLRGAGVPGRARGDRARTTLDGEAPHRAALDVLAQHVMGVACCGPFDADALYDEVRTRRALCASCRGGLRRGARLRLHRRLRARAYDRFRRIVRGADGLLAAAQIRRLARRHRLNVGTIVEAPMLRVRAQGPRGRKIGEIEECFVELAARPATPSSSPARLLRFEGVRETVADGHAWRRPARARRCRA